MMKILFITLSLCVLPVSFFCSLSLLFLTLTMVSFYTVHYMDNYLPHQLFMWDTMSFALISLTILITILMLLANLPNSKDKKLKSYFIFISLMLLLLLVLTFSVTNMILFYIFFEASLIPIIMMILGWGAQPERLQAGFYVLMYTILSSLPLLIALLLWMKISNSASIFMLAIIKSTGPLANVLAYAFLMTFSVKLPIFTLHLWLPKAHVEAPVAGSMVLAAILLKLGGYGMLRISSKCHMLYYMISPSMISWSLMGGLIMAMICVFQSDVKFLIALSSVAHMSLVMASVLTFSAWGTNSALIIMISHGFCSSGLFCAANIFYERSNSRSLYLLKGLQVIFPSMSMMWFMLCTSNMAAPPSLGLLGEMMSISAIYSWSAVLMSLLMLMAFMTAVYSLFLFSQMQHGKLSSNMSPSSPPSLREWLMLSMHWMPLNLLFLAPWIVQIYV